MLTLLTIVLSLFFLVKSANIFVDQASSLAKKYKVSDFIIGFTIVSIGTTLPELISTVFSALSGRNQLVISNIIGSNITNFCLVFGIMAVFHNFRIRKRDVNINIPLNMAGLMVFWALSAYMGFTLTWTSGISLILVLIILLILSRDYNDFVSTKKNYVKYNSLILVFSLLLLIVSGKICINQTINLANQLKISEAIIGYFILALGTSLPELVTAWVAVKKNSGDLAVGNILGANLLNLLLISGISTFIQPLEISHFKTDLVFLTAITLAVYFFAIRGKKYSFSKREGLSMIFLYLLFVLFQISRI